MITFCKPSFDYNEIAATTEVIESGWLAAGEKTKQFEEEFARYVGVKYAIFTNSGTAGLKMAYKYMASEGYEVGIVPRNTFCATYTALHEMGLMHSFKDVVIDRFNKPFTVNVHYGGVKDETPCDIEDSAHRIEANDPLVGKIRIYSFYVTKNLTTGAGGMFVTNDEDIYKKARLWWMDGINKTTFDRQHGGWDYEILANAGGYDGNDLAAAIGIEQLKKLPKFTERRNEIRDRYNREFNQSWQGNHLYPYFVKSEKDVSRLINYLKEDNIQASYHYPNTGWLGVSLPIYPLLDDIEQYNIIESIRRFK